MRHSQQGRFRQQVKFLRRQFLQEGHLPFTDVLSAESLSQPLKDIAVCWKDRIFTPLVTLWVFLGQVLSADPSCRAAVARLIAHRVSQGLKPCSSETGAYCQARKRLPEAFFSAVACQVGRTLDAQVDPQWLWKGRRVYLFDGSTVSMPDTPENQQAYPQLYNQKPGTGFPIARIAAVISLSCGAILKLGICRYAGKGQSELGMLRTLWNLFRPGDVLLADRLMCAWTEMVMLKARGVDCVCRLTSHRTALPTAISQSCDLALVHARSSRRASPSRRLGRRSRPARSSCCPVQLARLAGDGRHRVCPATPPRQSCPSARVPAIAAM